MRLRTRIGGIAAAVTAVLVTVGPSADAGDRAFRDLVVVKGRVVTGTNRYLGMPQSDLGAPFGTAGFSNVGAHNRAGSQPLPLTQRSPGSTVLATFVDPEFLSIVGKTPADVNPAVLNIPINDVPVNVSPAGDQRVPLNDEHRAGALEASRAEPNRTVTLADWARADGVAIIRCGPSGNHLTLRLDDLLPNKLYTAWAIVGTSNGLAPLPMGGVPNAMVTDSEGRATFSRSLRKCPTDPSVTDGQLLLIDIVMHSDNQVYGAMPDLPLAGLFTGAVNQTHLEFPIRGQSLR